MRCICLFFLLLFMPSYLSAANSLREQELNDKITLLEKRIAELETELITRNEINIKMNLIVDEFEKLDATIELLRIGIIADMKSVHERIKKTEQYAFELHPAFTNVQSRLKALEGHNQIATTQEIIITPLTIPNFGPSQYDLYRDQRDFNQRMFERTSRLNGFQ